jgi:signal recognition particle receptor subunit beta
VNFQRSYIRFKVVYYGPGLCGKTTNLEKLHEISGGGVEMISLETEGDRTIFFDYMPLNLGKLGGVETVFKLYTVPGQVRYNRTRRMVLRDVDGVVFVADSQRAAMSDNVESLRNLQDNLAEDGLSLASIPMVMQYNKRDLDDISTVEELNEALNPVGRQWLESSAVEGRNVKETLVAIARAVYKMAAQRYGLAPALSLAPANDDPIEGERTLEADTWSQAPGSPRDEDGGSVDPPPAWSDTMPPGGMRTVAPGASAQARDSAGPDPVLRELTSRIEGRLMKQFVEVREILQQLVMTQVEGDHLDELKDNLMAAQREMGEEMERGSAGIAAMREAQDRILERLTRMEAGLVALDGRVGTLRDDIRQEVRRDVDRHLAEFLETAGPAARPRQGEAPARPIENKPAASRGSGLRNLRETNAPPRKSSGRGGHFGDDGKG